MAGCARTVERNDMAKRLFLTGLFLAAALTSVSAQSRHQQENACGRDASRLCKAYLDSGDMAVLACLKSNAAKLRPVCVAFLREKGQL